ncbi:MAG: hypothetical protein IJ946_01655 [Clostridia bacterium]|nr:hypothetical protein [Clostridia bacterium]
MHIYDTLIIGSGYSSLGYALKNENSIICEENQICDTHFYLPLKTFSYKEYTPKTEYAKKLLGIFNSLSVINGDMLNTNALECGICKFITETKVKILLKCRVIKAEKENGIFKATIQTNQGLSFIYAKKVLNTLSSDTDPFFTTLFITDNIEKDKAALLNEFKDGNICPAFYRNRYALQINAKGFDENTVKTFIYEKWKKLKLNAKILYMAPVFYYNNATDGLSDRNYQNPIEAFEAGYFYKEG